MFQFEKVEEGASKPKKTTKKVAVDDSEDDDSEVFDEEVSEPEEKPKKAKKKSVSLNKTTLAKKSLQEAENLNKIRQSGSRSSNFKAKINAPNKSTKRNYWTEYYDVNQRRWICNYLII